MRLWIILILSCLGVWYFWPDGENSSDDTPVMSAEDTFIGPQVKVLNSAKGYEEQHLEATRQHQEKLEQQLQDGGGG